MTLLTLAVWWLCERAAVAVVRLLTLPRSYAAVRAGRRPAPTAAHSVASAAVLLSAPRRGPPVVAGHA